MVIPCRRLSPLPCASRKVFPTDCPHSLVPVCHQRSWTGPFTVRCILACLSACLPAHSRLAPSDLHPYVLSSSSLPRGARCVSPTLVVDVLIPCNDALGAAVSTYPRDASPFPAPLGGLEDRGPIRRSREIYPRDASPFPAPLEGDRGRSQEISVPAWRSRRSEAREGEFGGERAREPDHTAPQ